MSRQRRNIGTPWARASALAAACSVTLIGVVSGLEPETILHRAVISAIITGVTVALFVAVAQFVLKQT